MKLLLRLLSYGIALVVLGLGAVPPVATAQERPSLTTSDLDDQPLIRRVRITGNDAISTSRLRQRIQTQANRRVLSIPGFTWWRWVYQFGDTIGGRVGDAFRASGEAPAYLDPAVIDNDVERLRVFYEQQGFRDADITVDVEEDPEDHRATVHFRIDEGPPTYLRSLEYVGLRGLPESVQEEIVNVSVFDEATPSDDNRFKIDLAGERYETPRLLEERQRILRALRNGGYAAVSRDSIRALVFTPQPDSFDVQMRVRPGPRYRFGDVNFEVEGPLAEGNTRTAMLDVAVDSSAGWTPTVSATIRSERRLSPALLERALQFTPGDYYSQEQLLATKRRLEGTGAFTFTNLSPQLSDTLRHSEGEDVFLPIRVEARTRERHQLRAETFALQREVVSDVESELGLGVGLTYENTNVLGGGERFQMRTAASVATNLDSLTSVQLEAEPSLTLPYLVYPFGGLDDWFSPIEARTRLSLSGLTARRDDLRLRIRARLGAQLRLELDHTESLRSLIDVVDLTISNPDTLDQFSERFLDRVLGPGDGTGITDPVQRRQIVEDYTEPQFNSALRYTLQSITANPLRRERGHVYEGSFEVGNVIPLALDWFAFSPGSLTSTVPGFGGQSLLYRPYLRGQVDLRRYLRLGGGRSTLALRAFGGMAHPFGIPNVVPFDRRYFSGGGTSVRGWGLRELGPGSTTLLAPGADMQPSANGDVANILGGDIKLEANVELRTRVIRGLLAANWLLTGFADAGNVWFGPRNPGLATAAADGQPERASGRFQVATAPRELGVGAGLGLRIAWEFFIVRLDLAYRMHDPSPLNNDVFRNGFRDPRLHFGIGHSF
ncbi:MAG: BamA/TamA family outer membrane protein [Longimonas sp.]|uniref:BamA/TamA family outer membrane protein n=1 Tax=Longimonas sp. TaxID=2039626 RepID=UPI003976B41D